MRVAPSARAAPPARAAIHHERRIPRGLNYARDASINIEALPSFSIGAMDQECRFCEALHFIDEQISRTRDYGSCCLRGRISLAFNDPPPPPLRDLIVCNRPNDPEEKRLLSTVFHDNWRALNGAFAMTSVGVTIDRDINQLRGQGAPWVFKIMGRLHHQIPAFEPAPNRSRSYGQFYIMDSALESRNLRIQWISRTGDSILTSARKADILDTIHEVLHTTHPFIQLFKTAYERLCEQPANIDRIAFRLIDDPTKDRRRYNKPTANEVAILIPGDGEQPSHRDIVVRRRTGHYQSDFISDTNGMYWPMHYPLFFSYGEIGWRDDIPKADIGKLLSLSKYRSIIYLNYTRARRQWTR
jgi:hypothetical protein